MLKTFEGGSIILCASAVDGYALRFPAPHLPSRERIDAAAFARSPRVSLALEVYAS